MKKQKISLAGFRTRKNRYLYDGVSGEVIPADDEIEYIIHNFYNVSPLKMKKEFNLMEDDRQFDAKYEYINRLLKSGMFYKKGTTLKDYNDNIIHKAASSQLIIVLTESCNLRCEYCVYSDKYPKEISYSSSDIDFKTAKTAVDTYFELHNKKVEYGYRRDPMVNFYGGEPLIRFDIIKKVVEYAKKKSKNTKFYITTNGVLLSQEMAEFISSNNFFITFSLDGYKENHDRNRVTANQKPTFDLIYKNIVMLQETKKRKGLEQIISFNCCFDHYTDLQKAAEFFVEHYDIFAPFFTMYSQISPYDTSYYIWTKEKINKEKLNLSENAAKDTYERIKTLFYDADNTNIKFKEIILNLLLSQYAILIRDKWTDSMFNNSCIPLAKLAVYPDGTYTLCEKMNKKLSIGNTRDGILYKKINKMIDLLIDNFKFKRCSECIVQRICPACFMYMNENGAFNEEFCHAQQESFEKKLSELYELLEKDPKLISRFLLHQDMADILDVNH